MRYSWILLTGLAACGRTGFDDELLDRQATLPSSKLPISSPAPSVKPSGAHARSYDLLYDACPTCDETGPPLRLDIDEEADPPRYAVSVAWGETAAFDAVDTGT